MLVAVPNTASTRGSSGILSARVERFREPSGFGGREARAEEENGLNKSLMMCIERRTSYQRVENMRGYSHIRRLVQNQPTPSVEDSLLLLAITTRKRLGASLVWPKSHTCSSAECMHDRRHPGTQSPSFSDSPELCAKDPGL